MTQAKPKGGAGRHVALLRGINVGGHNPLPMPLLKGLFEAAGCADVATFIQSGNVVFSADAALVKRVPVLLPQAILKAAGFECPVIVRGAAQLAKVAAAHPLRQAGDPEKILNVGFLARTPGPGELAALDPQRSPGDSFLVQGGEIYLRFGAGTAATKLSNQYFDSRLKTVVTVRNWNTVRTLAELAKA